MLSTLIYRSHIKDEVSVKLIEEMVGKANQKNELFDVTGILLFNGSHFFQLLEGPEEAVLSIYHRLCEDDRHHNLVELMRDYAPARRFGNVGMELFDLREHDKSTVLNAVLNKGTSKYQLTWDDRALQFLRTFVEAREKEHYFEIPQDGSWRFISEQSQPVATVQVEPDAEYSFAFQPIIDPMSQEIVSWEALLRTVAGESSDHYFSRLTPAQRHAADLASKKRAFAMARELEIGQASLSVNLLPMSLVRVPDAVEMLLEQIAENGLVPEQVIIEFTEYEVISQLEEFGAAIRKLKAAGLSLAIDDFGAGFAGLQLLSRFQPDRIKINRAILSDVHKSGPKQAIVHAILTCCSSLEIAVTACGVEKMEEWMWLESAGITHFQGYLFARPLLNGKPAVAWPDKI